MTALFCDWFGMNPLHKTVTVVSVIKSPVLLFHWLLFDTTSRNRIPTGTLISDPVVLSGRQCKPAMAHGCHGIYPLRGSLRAALIAWSLLKGLWLDGSIIIGCSGRCRQPAIDCFEDKSFPLCTFDVILLTDPLTVCRWSWRILLCASPFGWTAKVSVLPDMTVKTVFAKEQKRKSIPFTLFHAGRRFCTP